MAFVSPSGLTQMQNVLLPFDVLSKPGTIVLAKSRLNLLLQPV